jgi:hypothetical protein
MLRIDRAKHTMVRLGRTPFEAARILERSDLQQMIRNASADFFAELGERLLPLGEEIRPSEVVDDRIDLLALDTDGSVVIIELKRGAHKLQLLQALAYAALISDWKPDRLTAERARFARKSDNEAEEEIDEHLDEGSSTLNVSQRVILVAEEYDFEVLATAKWLSELYDVDIACWRAELASDTSGEYLSLSCIYPPPELAKALGAVERRAPSILPGGLTGTRHYQQLRIARWWSSIARG